MTTESPSIDITALDLNDLRRQVLEGKKLSDELTRQVIAQIRASRRSAVETAATAKKTAGKRKSKAMSDEELDKTFSDLGL